MRILVLSVCLSAVACSHPSAPVGPVAWTADDILAVVPAESPYVMAHLDLTDEATRAHEVGLLGEGSMQAAMDALGHAKSTDSPARRALAAAIAEVATVPAARRAESVGLANDFRFVVYGDPVYPVMRAEVADAVRLRQVVRKVAAAYGPEVVEHPGALPYWTLALGSMTAVVVVHDRDLTGALLATEQLTARLPALLANTRPAHSLRETTDIAALLARHQLRHELFSMVDMTKVAVQVAEVHSLGLDSPACRDDLAQAAAIMPRIIVGYREHDPKHVRASIIVELQPAIAQALAKLRVAMPSISKDPLVTMGIGVDVDGALAFAADVARRVHDHAFACAPFAKLNQLAAMANEALAEVPPQAHGMRGFAFALDDLSLEPKSYRGAALVLGTQLPKLLHDLPLIGALPITTDGHPFELPVAAFGIPGLSSAHVALAPDRLAIGAGDHSDDLATAALAAKDDPKAPMFAFYMNSHWFATHLDAERGKSFQLFDDLTTTVDVRDDGLVFDFGATWSR